MGTSKGHGLLLPSLPHRLALGKTRQPAFHKNW